MKSIKLFPMVLNLSIILFLTGSCAKDLEMNEAAGEFQQWLDQQIPEWMEKYEVPGLAITLIKNGDIDWSGAYGFADRRNQIKMTPITVCRVESISKSVTARGVMKLVELGKIRLDDPVSEYLISWEFPDSEFDVERVTIRHLLSHSSGLPLGTLGLEYAPGDEKPSLRESLSREVRIVREPGSKFNYSNVGYHLLELLIEDVTGREFSEFMADEVLTPLKMPHSSFEWSKDFITPVPNGYNLNGDPIPVYVYSEKGAGGLFANAEDIAHFVSTGMVNDFYSSESILSEQSIRELYTPVMDVSGLYSVVADQYGLGHFIETLPDGRTAVFGGGQGNGWMTHFHLVPEAGEGIVILTNSSGSWPLISNILSDWAAWNGFGSVGMGIISKAITGAWILIFLTLSGLIIQLIRIIRDYLRNMRQFDVQFKNYSSVQFVLLALFLILSSILIWGMTREYLMITSVFPGVSGWLFFIIFLSALICLIMALMQENDGRIQGNGMIES
jgi:CubicO group peptidase (beta-lactamase class C family)